jgi:hypothetical protein
LMTTLPEVINRCRRELQPLPSTAKATVPLVHRKDLRANRGDMVLTIENVFVLGGLLRCNPVGKFDLGCHLVTSPVRLVALQVKSSPRCQSCPFSRPHAKTHLVRLSRKTDIEIMLIQLFHGPVFRDPLSTSVQPDVLGSLFLLGHQMQPGSVLSPPIIIRVALSLGITVTRRRPPPKDLVDRLFRPRLVLFQSCGVGGVFVSFHRREEELVVSHVFREDKDGTHDGVSREIERHGSVQLLSSGVLAPVEPGSYVLDKGRR